MDFVVTWDGGAQYENLIVRTPDGRELRQSQYVHPRRRHRRRGAGEAACASGTTTTSRSLTSRCTTAKNTGCIPGGGHGYELIANNVYAKCTLSGLAGNCGICSRLSDSHYTDCIVVDYTVGHRDRRLVEPLTRCHVWGGIVKPLHGYTQDEWCALYNKRKFGAPDAARLTAGSRTICPKCCTIRSASRSAAAQTISRSATPTPA